MAEEKLRRDNINLNETRLYLLVGALLLKKKLFHNPRIGLIVESIVNILIRNETQKYQS